MYKDSYIFLVHSRRSWIHSLIIHEMHYFSIYSHQRLRSKFCALVILKNSRFDQFQFIKQFYINYDIWSVIVHWLFILSVHKIGPFGNNWKTFKLLQPTYFFQLSLGRFIIIFTLKNNHVIYKKKHPWDELILSSDRRFNQSINQYKCHSSCSYIILNKKISSILCLKFHF